MESDLEVQQLYRACEILFGTDLHISMEFLEYLQPSGLKSAYRKRALETHPDRLIDTDRLLRLEIAERFHSVQNAYEQLFGYLQAKERCRLDAETCRSGAVRSHPSAKPIRSSGPTQGERNAHTDNGCQQGLFSRHSVNPASFPHRYNANAGPFSTEKLYRGPLPPRRLLFGHFLYYSGLANWRTITRILIWQRRERPRLGELGLRFGMLSSENISLILRHKMHGQLFGQTARRLGLLSEKQTDFLIFHQQRLKKKFGEILLEKQLITQQELEELLIEFEQHNVCWRGK